MVSVYLLYRNFTLEFGGNIVAEFTPTSILNSFVRCTVVKQIARGRKQIISQRHLLSKSNVGLWLKHCVSKPLLNLLSQKLQNEKKINR